MSTWQNWVGETPADAIILILAIITTLAALGFFRKSRLLGHEKEILEKQIKSSKDRLNKYKAEARTRDPDAFWDELKTKQLYGTRESQEKHAGLYISNHKTAMSKAAMIMAEKAYMLGAENGEINLAKAESWLDMGLSINPDDKELHQFLRELKEIEITKDTPFFDASADAGTLSNIGRKLQGNGNYKQAQIYLEVACSKSVTADGKKSQKYANHLNNLAELYRVMGDYPSAEPLYKQSIAISQNALPSDHPQTKAIKANFAIMQAERGRG